MNQNRVLWVAQTAVFLALLVVLQAATAALGNPIVTGSVVNLLLILSVMLLGLGSGCTVAVLSPVLAKLFGIGPLWSLIPFIILGNFALVAVWHFVGSRSTAKPRTAYILALAAASVIKFLVLYLGIARFAVPVLLRLSEPQATVISGMFSVPQLVTALAGGAVACIVLPVLQTALRQGSNAPEQR